MRRAIGPALPGSRGPRRVSPTTPGTSIACAPGPIHPEHHPLLRTPLLISRGSLASEPVRNIHQNTRRYRADPTRTSQPDQATAPPARVARPPMAPKLRDQDRYDILGEHGRGGL